MGYPTRVQLIKRKDSEQWYINFPVPIAQAMQFRKGEIAEWSIEDIANLVLHRTETPPSLLKKKPVTVSSPVSTSSGSPAGTPSTRRGRGAGRKASS